MEEEQGNPSFFNSVVEPAMTVATGAVAEVGAGLSGLATTVTEGPEAGAKEVERVKEEYTYVPRSEEGKESLETIGNLPVLKQINDFIGWAEENLGDATLELTGSPELATAAHTIPTALGIFTGTKGAKNLEVGDIEAKGPGKKQAGMFGGVKAKNANTDALLEADAMEAKGATRDEIWDATGWWKDGDDWKFEISDKLMKVDKTKWDKEPTGGQLWLEEIVNHKQLERSYPEAFQRNVVISKHDLPKGTHGAAGFDDTTGVAWVALNGNMKWDKEEMRSTILHELQHGIPQRIEDFDSGGAPDAMVDLVKEGFENEQKGLLKLKKQLDPNNPEDVKDFNNRVKNMIDKAKKNTKTAANYPNLAYKLSAGEAEARNVETRKDFSRDTMKPWETLDVKEDELIRYKTNPGVQYSIKDLVRRGKEQGILMYSELKEEDIDVGEATIRESFEDLGIHLVDDDILDELFADFSDFETPTRSNRSKTPEETIEEDYIAPKPHEATMENAKGFNFKGIEKPKEIKRVNEVESFSKFTEEVPTKFLRLMQGNKQRRNPEELQELTNKIAKEGVKSPVMLTVDYQTGQAVLGEGNHRVAIQDFLGNTDTPVRIARKHSGFVKGEGPCLSDYFIFPKGKHVPGDAKFSEVFNLNKIQQEFGGN